MSDRLAKFAGPHGGGYLLLVLLPFGIMAWALLLYLALIGADAIYVAYEIAKWWPW